MSITKRIELTDEQKTKIDCMRDGFSMCEGDINKYVPPGRLRSIALTQLEIAWVMATRGIVKDWKEESPAPEASQDSDL